MVLPAGALAAGRITNGTKVDTAGFDARWHAIVSVRPYQPGQERVPYDPKDPSGARDAHTCGGTLIRPDVVVTAAHCVEGWGTIRIFGQGYEVLAGTHVLTNTNEQPGQVVRVAEVRVHPNWKPAINFFDEPQDLGYDVALLRLAQPVTVVAPMPLVAADERSLWGGGAGLPTGARTAGWGMTAPINDDEEDDSPGSNVQRDLRETELPLLPDRRCESTDSSMGDDAELFERATMICGDAPDTNPKRDVSSRRGTCYGDSGGPLIVPAPDGTWRLAGIVSWGPSSAGGCNRASVFTRVDAMRDWIDASIADTTPPGAGATFVSAATQAGPNALQLRWTPGSGAPIRHAVYRQVPLRSIFPGDWRRFSEDLSPAAARFLAGLKVLQPVGSGGADADSLIVRELAPRRPGQQLQYVFRIEVRDGAGRRMVGAATTVDAPIDSRPPNVLRRPAARVQRNGLTVLRWRPVFDDDCVDHYVVTIRRSTSAPWRRIATQEGWDCPSGSAGFFDDFFDDGEDDSGMPDTTFQQPLLNVRPGTYQVRVAAFDRAGNRRLGGIGLARVERRIRRPSSSRRCFGTGDERICVVETGSTSAVGTTDPAAP